MSVPNPDAPDPHRFTLKGKAAEAAIQALAEQTFFVDWCFPNPRWQDKGKTEVCDLLVVYDRVALLWAVTDGRRPEHNLRQLAGAHRNLMTLARPIELQNARRKGERFDPKGIERVFLLSAVMGEDPPGSLFAEANGKLVHVCHGKSLQIILGELDTIFDFVKYLERKEEVRRGTGPGFAIRNGGEEDLLAYYLQHNRSFPAPTDADGVVIGGGAWGHLAKHPQYIAKKRADGISELWDRLTSHAHTMDIEHWERFAREMARPTRLQRRMLSQDMYDLYEAYCSTARGAWKSRRRMAQMDGTTFCFTFVDESLDASARETDLLAWMHVARDRFRQNVTVVGIAWVMADEPYPGTFSVFIAERWTDEGRGVGPRVRGGGCGGGGSWQASDA